MNNKRIHALCAVVTIFFICCTYLFYDENAGNTSYVSNIIGVEVLTDNDLARHYKMIEEIILDDIHNISEAEFSTPILSNYKFSSNTIAIKVLDLNNNDISLNLASDEYWDDKDKCYYNYLWRVNYPKSDIIYRLDVPIGISTTIGLPNDMFPTADELILLTGKIQIYELQGGQ